MDCVFIRDLHLEAKVGIYRRERHTTQTVAVDLEIALPHDRMFTTGKVADTIDYAVVVQRIQTELSARHFGLVEELAAFVAQLIIDEFHSPHVRVSIAKLGILKNAGRVGVTVERSHTP